MTRPATAKRRAQAPATDHDLMQQFLKESHQPGAQTATVTNTKMDTGKDGPPFRLMPSSEIKLDRATRYLVKGLINQGEVSIWYGATGCGKSFAVLHAAMGIATGAEAVFKRKAKKANVGIFWLEGSAHGLSKRVHGLKSRPANLLFYSDSHFNLYADKTIADKLIETVRFYDLGVVFIDTLSASAPGAKENQSEDMTIILAALKRVARETNAAVVVIHHPGKKEENGMRGSYSLQANVEGYTLFEKRVAANVATIQKARDDASGEQFAFRLMPFTLPGLDDEDKPITTQTVNECDVPVMVKTKDDKLTARDQKILRVVGDMMNGTGRALKDEVATRASQEFDWNNATAQKFIRAAIKSGLLATDKTYVWPDAKPM